MDSKELHPNTILRMQLDNLVNLDIPKERRDIDNPRNVDWLLRNLRANNADHPDIDTSMDALRQHAAWKRSMFMF
jgi:hypothetical protein